VGGIAGADGICRALSTTVSYRALIAGGTRLPSTTTVQSLNWPVRPLASYVTVARDRAITVHFVAGPHGELPSTLQNRVTSTAGSYWSGLASTTSNGVDCGDWATNSGNGLYGTLDATDFTFFAPLVPALPAPCTALRHLLCIEQ
jgi:hypothetical protein